MRPCCLYVIYTEILKGQSQGQNNMPRRSVLGVLSIGLLLVFVLSHEEEGSVPFAAIGSDLEGIMLSAIRERYRISLIYGV